MPLQCNIDSKGRLARLIYGLILTVVAVVLVFAWAIPSGGVVAWAVTVLLLAGGILALFEARKGWCIMRAMGFKTPM